MVKRQEIDRPEFLSVPAAAELCGVSRNTLYSWVRQNKLKAYKTPGRTNLIRPHDLVQFMQTSGMFVPPGLIDLARRDAALGAELEGDAGDSVHAKEHSLLIVDDEPAVRSVLVRALDGIAPIYQAGTGFEALHLITVRTDIKLVLLDIQMPGQVGDETFREIKRLRPDLKVLVVTGFAPDIPSDMKNDPMIVDILDKPVDIHELHEKVAGIYRAFEA